MKSSETRIACSLSKSVAEQLNQTASQLDISKVKAMQLAISTLHVLAERVGQGATLVVRSKEGKETELLIPQIPIQSKE